MSFLFQASLILIDEAHSLWRTILPCSESTDFNVNLTHKHLFRRKSRIMGGQIYKHGGLAKLMCEINYHKSLAISLIQLSLYMQLVSCLIHKAKRIFKKFYCLRTA